MQLLSPVWLIGLIPWAAVVVWMMIGRSPRAAVPFLDLWRGPVAMPRTHRALHLPPLPIICFLLALLASILAAARPIARSLSSEVTAVVDLGVTMSTPARMQEILDRLRELRPSNTIYVPSDARPSPSGGSAIDTKSLLPPTIREALQMGDQPVLVLSDQQLDLDNPRVVQVPPQSMPENVGIVRLSARENPAAQIMVRLRNQSQQKTADVIVQSGEFEARRTIELPPPASEQDYFVDAPKFDRSISLQVAVDDDLPWDNRAWLTRTGTWAKLRPQTSLPPELLRMIKVYEKARPAEPNSVHLSIVAGEQSNANIPAVEIAPRADAMLRKPDELRIADHPIAAHVDWKSIVKDATVAAAPPDRWKPIVSAGEQVLVAVRDAPARQVWVGFDSPTWSRTSDYVLFWTDVFDWAGEGGEEFAGEPVRALEDWQRIDPPPAANENAAPQPGLYQGPEGAIRALNAIDIRFDPPLTVDWRAKLKAVTLRARGNYKVSLPLALLAVVLAACGLVGISRFRTPVEARSPAET